MRTIRQILSLVAGLYLTITGILENDFIQILLGTVLLCWFFTDILRDEYHAANVIQKILCTSVGVSFIIVGIIGAINYDFNALFIVFVILGIIILWIYLSPLIMILRNKRNISRIIKHLKKTTND